MTQNLEVKAGRLFCFSSGEYSDYGYRGHYLALRDIDRDFFHSVIEGLKDDFKKKGVPCTYTEERTAYKDADSYEIESAIERFFLPAIIRSGAVMEIDVQEIYLGSYGQIELV